MKVMHTHLALLAGSAPQRNPVFPTERSRGMGTTFPNSTLFETFMIETLNQKPLRFFEDGESGQLPVTDTGSSWKRWLESAAPELPTLATILVSRLQDAAESFFLDEPEPSAPSEQQYENGADELPFPVFKPVENPSSNPPRVPPIPMQNISDLQIRLEKERNRYFLLAKLS